MKLLIETESKVNEREMTAQEIQTLYRAVFNTPEGKEVLQHLANISGVFRSSFTMGRSDYVSFLEGRRDLFFTICHCLEEERENIEGDI